MVYRLTCPACRNVQESPFVRLGAVAPCPSCGKAFRVEAGMIIKVASVPNPQAAAAAKEPAPPPPPPPPPKKGDSMVGLSGLSEVMRQQAGDSGQRPAMDTPPAGRLVGAGQAVVPGPPPSPQELRQIHAQQRAVESARRRRRKLLLGVLVVMTLLMGLVGVIIAILADRPAEDSSDGPPGDVAVLDPAAAGDAAVVMTVHAAGVGTDHPAFFAHTRYDVRATVTPARQRGEDGGEGGAGEPADASAVTAVLVRLVTTQADPPPPPFDLLLTASDADRNLGSWTFRYDGPITRDRGAAFEARLLPPLSATGAQWICTAYQPAAAQDQVADDAPAPRPRP